MRQKPKRKGWWKTALAALFWLLVWQLASMAMDEVLFLPSPLLVAQVLVGLLPTALFWQAVGTSLVRIGAGFFLGLAAGLGLAWAASAARFVEVLLRPMMQFVKATPVASFTILVLLWFSGRGLSTAISFLMVLPVIYTGAYSGIASADKQLLEMAGVFRVGFGRRLRAIYLPALMPQLLAACELGLGLCWKSGVAAEVIGLSEGTIGMRLYQAKNFLLTPELFAWTAVIILLSWLFAKAVLALFRRLAAAVTGVKGVAGRE